MTAALEGGEWSAARPGRTLPPGKTRYPLYRRLVGPQGRSGRAENLVPTEIRSRTVQPVVSRYTDWATGPTLLDREHEIPNAVGLNKIVREFKQLNLLAIFSAAANVHTLMYTNICHQLPNTSILPTVLHLLKQCSAGVLQ